MKLNLYVYLFYLHLILQLVLGEGQELQVVVVEEVGVVVHQELELSLDTTDPPLICQLHFLRPYSSLVQLCDVPLQTTVVGPGSQSML